MNRSLTRQTKCNVVKCRYAYDGAPSPEVDTMRFAPNVSKRRLEISLQNTHVLHEHFHSDAARVYYSNIITPREIYMTRLYRQARQIFVKFGKF